jgi:hypothetical protein
MPLIGLLVVALQIYCAVHAYRRGRGSQWIWIIIALPVVGCLIYLFAEIFPLHHVERHAAGLSRTLMRAVDPGRVMRLRIDDAAACGSVNNKIALAEECVRSGFYDDAIKLYSTCLDSIYRDDSMLMYGLAIAFFAKEEFGFAKEWFQRLLAVAPNYKSGEARLYFARTLEALRDTAAAQREYELLKSSFTGEEARCRYALWLKKTGSDAQAAQLLEEILPNARRAPRYYRREQNEWIAIAENELRRAAIPS